MNGLASFVATRNSAEPLSPNPVATGPGCSAFDVIFCAASRRADSRANQMLHSFELPYVIVASFQSAPVARSSQLKRENLWPSEETVTTRDGAAAARAPRSS